MTDNMVLSYIITTRNKLLYLQETLPSLLNDPRPDEEVLIVDGASTDGTRQYLADLLQARKIQYYASEPDIGEAHGLNRALLQTRGKFIKVITDDDVFSYPTIRSVCQFMQSNPDVDVVGTETATLVGPDGEIASKNESPSYSYWNTNKAAPLAFCGLGLMIRRSALPAIGLFDVTYTAVDTEYSRRISNLAATEGSQLGLAWYSGITAVQVLHASSNSKKQLRRIYEDYRRLGMRYRSYRSVKDCLSNSIYQLTEAAVLHSEETRYSKHIKRMYLCPSDKVIENFEKCKLWLAEYNALNPGQFLSDSTV